MLHFANVFLSSVMNLIIRLHADKEELKFSFVRMIYFSERTKLGI